MFESNPTWFGSRPVLSQPHEQHTWPGSVSGLLCPLQIHTRSSLEVTQISLASSECWTTLIFMWNGCELMWCAYEYECYGYEYTYGYGCGREVQVLYAWTGLYLVQGFWSDAEGKLIGLTQSCMRGILYKCAFSTEHMQFTYWLMYHYTELCSTILNYTIPTTHQTRL